MTLEWITCGSLTLPFDDLIGVSRLLFRAGRFRQVRWRDVKKFQGVVPGPEDIDDNASRIEQAVHLDRLVVHGQDAEQLPFYNAEAFFIDYKQLSSHRAAIYRQDGYRAAPRFGRKPFPRTYIGHC